MPGVLACLDLCSGSAVEQDRRGVGRGDILGASSMMDVLPHTPHLLKVCLKVCRQEISSFMEFYGRIVILTPDGLGMFIITKVTALPNISMWRKTNLEEK